MDRMTVNAKLKRQAEILRRIHKSSSRRPYLADRLMDHMGLSVAQVLTNKTHYNQTLGRIFEGLVLSAFIDLPGFEPGLFNGRRQPADVVLGVDAIELKYSIADTSPQGEKYRQRRWELMDEGLNPVALVFRDCPNAPHIFRNWELHQGQACIDYIERRSGQTFQQLLDAHSDFLDG